MGPFGLCINAFSGLRSLFRKKSLLTFSPTFSLLQKLTSPYLPKTSFTAVPSQNWRKWVCRASPLWNLPYRTEHCPWLTQIAEHRWCRQANHLPHAVNNKPSMPFATLKALSCTCTGQDGHSISLLLPDIHLSFRRHFAGMVC
jgi:hypothetical protein